MFKVSSCLIHASPCTKQAVVDHILTLQQSLAHYERMLSQLQPTYLNNLRVALSLGRSSGDKAIFILTFVSMAVLPPQIIIGMHLTSLHHLSCWLTMS